MKIKLYESFSEEQLIPKIFRFTLDKYNKLSNWTKNNFSVEPATIEKFQAVYNGDNWDLEIIAPNWSRNEANRKIQYIFEKDIKKYAHTIGFNIRYIRFSGASSYTEHEKYFVYDFKTNKIEKNI